MRGETRLLASLNHSNIAAIYGLEEADEFGAVVLNWFEELKRLAPTN